MRRCTMMALAALLIADVRALDRDEIPEPFGVGFVDAAAVKPRALPPLKSAPEAEQWRQRIRDKVWAQGPYGADISETLLDAGNYFHSRGDYRSAIVQWRRAVHLIRVNDGLYSQLQLPTLERLLDTYLALGDLEAADQVQSYLHHLSGETYAPDDPAYVEATVAWIDWVRHRWLRSPDSHDGGELMSLWRLLERETQEEEGDELEIDHLEPLVYAQLRVLYVIEVSDFGLDREAELMLGRQYAGAVEPNVDRTHVQALQENAYSRGRRRLELLDARLSAQGLPLRQAKLQRVLGDWHQWHGRYRRATESYRASWELLAEAGRDDLHSDWYGTPVALPADDILWSGVLSPEKLADSSVVVARFTVSERGRARDVDTTPADPEQGGGAIRLYRMLRDSRFRPRLEDGEPVETPGFTREYRIF